MNETLARLRGRLKARLAPFLDLTAWVLLLISIVPLLFIDSAMVITLVQWTAFGLALAGVSVVISRVVLPQVRLSEWLELARKDNPAAGLIAFGVIALVGLIFLALVLWAKA